MTAADKVTRIRAMKGRERIAALTAYDFAMAKLLDAAGVPLLHVGDSVGMVVLGYPDTTFVTLDEIEYHVRAVARAKPKALISADMPFGSCESPAKAVQSARRLIAAGAEAVKIEGGRSILPQIQAIIGEGIPVLGHLGMLPQNAVAEGGYHVKGKTEDQRLELMADSAAVAQAGAIGVVLELVTATVARDITAQVSVPTIGIGAGPHCDGEILVTNDLLGTSPGFIPRHVKKSWRLAEQMSAAVVEWKESVVHPGHP
jgi:3-methyl-2-oxobutanoate hydroxymethyltransferase